MVERLTLMGVQDEVNAICARYGVTFEEARSRTRTPHVAAARHHVWLFLSGKGFSNSSIAAEWGVHHTTVGEAVRKLQGADAAQ